MTETYRWNKQADVECNVSYLTVEKGSFYAAEVVVIIIIIIIYLHVTVVKW